MPEDDEKNDKSEKNEDDKKDEKDEKLPVLFWAVLAVVGLALAAALVGADGEKEPSYALGSNLVYRLEVGLAVFGFFYILTLAVWLGAKNTGFLKLGAAGATAEAMPADAVEGAATDIAAISGEFEKFKDDTKSALLKLDKRVDALEKGAKRAEEG